MTPFPRIAALALAVTFPAVLGNWPAKAIEPGAVSQPSAEPTIPPATLDDSLEVSGEDLAAQMRESRMLLDVRINREGPFRFLVDSGADRSVVARSVADRLQLPAIGTGTLRGMAGTSEVQLVDVDRFGIGSSEMRSIRAPVLSDKDLGAQGVIGIDALADQRLMLDFVAKTVTVQDSRRESTAEDGDIVVTARRKRGQLILTQVSIAGQPLYAVIDTGADVTVGNMALFKALTRNRRKPEGKVTLISVTGQTLVADLMAVPELRVGGVTAMNVQVAFVDAPPFALFGLSRQPALLLGTDLLQAFRRVSLDFRRRKVRFSLRR
ncbi:aspartyl protease family protein [Sphingosinicellaceae bacterium]|nr:aspartyl protease family protein [Sphingosinicellaceae bacterium]